MARWCAYPGYLRYPGCCRKKNRVKKITRNGPRPLESLSVAQTGLSPWMQIVHLAATLREGRRPGCRFPSTTGLIRACLEVFFIVRLTKGILFIAFSFFPKLLGWFSKLKWPFDSPFKFVEQTLVLLTSRSVQ